MKNKLIKTLLATVLAVATLGTTVMAAPVATPVNEVVVWNADPYVEAFTLAKSDGGLMIYGLPAKKLNAEQVVDTEKNADIYPGADRANVLYMDRLERAFVMEYVKALTTGDTSKLYSIYPYGDCGQDIIDYFNYGLADRAVLQPNMPAGDVRILESRLAGDCHTTDTTWASYTCYDSNWGYFEIDVNTNVPARIISQARVLFYGHDQYYVQTYGLK